MTSGALFRAVLSAVYLWLVTGYLALVSHQFAVTY